jgi:hypothetical protein
VSVFWQEVWIGLDAMGKIFLILVPIVVFLDLLKTYGVLARLRRPIEPALRFLGFSPEAGEPFLAGVGFGMVYGAGIILARFREHPFSRKDIALLAGVLSAAHALPEDTLIFVSIGANGLLILGIRVALLIAVTLAVRGVFRLRPSPALGDG